MFLAGRQIDGGVPLPDGRHLVSYVCIVRIYIAPFNHRFVSTCIWVDCVDRSMTLMLASLFMA